MTGCIFLNRSYVKWQHALVLDLKKRYGVDKWCALGYGKGPYEINKTQNDINYEPLLINDILGVEAEKEVVDEKYLNQKEKEYGHPYFWQEFINDRHIAIDWPRQFYPELNPNRNYYQIKQQFQIRIREIEKMLDEAKPDFVLFVDAGAMAINLLYHIAKKKNIPTLILGINRPFGMAGVSGNLFGTFDVVDKIFREIRSGKHQSPEKGKAVELIKKFREKPIKPYYILPSESWNNFGQGTIKKLILFAKNFIRKFIDSFDKSFSDIYGSGPFDFARNNFILWRNSLSKFKFDKPDYSENFVFFPLHQEPELNLLMFAPYFADQGWTARTIAQSIPLTYKLYVKDHPLMFGYRNPKFYEWLKKFPNVQVIDPKFDSMELIKNCKLVTTISGTAGWEASFLKKPVITFGSIYYNSLSFIKKCKILDELPMLVKDALENYSHNEDELVDFTSALLEDSYNIDFTKLLNEKDVNILMTNPDLIKISDSIMKYIKNYV